MMRCKVCKRTFKKPNQNKEVWDKFGMCSACAIKKYPKKFSKHSRLTTLNKIGEYNSPKKKTRKDGRSITHRVGGV